MTQRKTRITGYYGKYTNIPFNFIPDGICLKLLLYIVDGFKIQHELNIDNEHVTQFIGYNKPAGGCGSVFGMKESI